MSKTITSKIIDGRAWTINDEFTIVDIPSVELDTVISWIKLNIIPNATPYYEVSSYDLAVALEKETGVYITNNQFKDAMLECGYYPADEGETKRTLATASGRMRNGEFRYISADFPHDVSPA